MDIDSKIQEKNSVLNMLWNQLKWFPMKLINKINNIANNTINIGKNDPRKIWHASKVGLSLTLVILFYYSWPLYHSFEQSAIMAVLTVMVAFEYTAGATISKCLNIAFATALGVSLGIGAKYLAEICGKEGEPIILGFLVFILGALGTFTRFYPHMQRRYDYGCMFSVATFSLVTVSGDRYLEMVKYRISTIMVSVATVMVISLVIRPVWAGKDLHNLIIANLEKLASFLDGFECEYFQAIGEGSKDKEKGFLEAFKSVLGSKATEESLAPTEFHKRTEEGCKSIIKKSSNALKYLALSIKTRTQPGPYNAKFAIDELRAALLVTTKTISEEDTIDVVSVASILIDVTRCVDEISKAVGELSIKAHFQKEKKKKDNSPSAPQLQLPNRGIVNAAVEEEENPIGLIKGEHVVCEIHAIEEEIKAKGK
ncbi:aluminum-activated malate transporter 8-like isoform X2 [Solanum lycopersicum]|uniref:aluminum-activated malate transporter 8-like isoform X2 n=1 Tax=Solanum lycopersicum TaxID=4081 RepID=UPI00374854BF